jgi:hypothetical protein
MIFELSLLSLIMLLSTSLSLSFDDLTHLKQEERGLPTCRKLSRRLKSQYCPLSFYYLTALSQYVLKYLVAAGIHCGLWVLSLLYSIRSLQVNKRKNRRQERVLC